MVLDLQRPGKVLRRKLRLIREIPKGCVWQVIRLGAFAALVPWIMRLSLSRSERILTFVSAKPGSSTLKVSDEKIETLVLCTDLALKLGRPITQDRCLTRCLTLYCVLGRQGLELIVVFGAGMLDGKFAAHCWLEQSGVPVFEGEDPYQVYSRTHTIPSTAFNTDSHASHETSDKA